jgi:hypothetical protein
MMLSRASSEHTLAIDCDACVLCGRTHSSKARTLSMQSTHASSNIALPLGTLPVLPRREQEGEEMEEEALDGESLRAELSGMSSEELVEALASFGLSVQVLPDAECQCVGMRLPGLQKQAPCLCCESVQVNEGRCWLDCIEFAVMVLCLLHAVITCFASEVH